MTARKWVAVLIGLGAACLFISALALGAGVLYFSRRSTSTAVVWPIWQDPLSVAGLKIDPPLSVATLAGTGDIAAINAMLARGELDSALVTALYAIGLSDRQRLAQLQLIGERYAAGERAASARLAYQAVMDIVALSPSLSDFDRADALAQAGAALYLAKDPVMAGQSLDAGDTIALQSSFLKDANRYVLLGRLLHSAQQGSDSARIQKLNGDQAKFVDSDPNPAAPIEPPDPLPTIDAPTKDDALAAAQGKRISAALSISKLAASGAVVPPDLIDGLNAALFAEDDQWTRIAAVPTTKLTLAQKVATLRAQIEWLTVKDRVARKAYGISIVPDWEDSEADIRSALAKAYENLNVLRTEQSVALPQTRDIELAQEYLLRRLLLAGRMGQYPNFPENDLVDQLNNATDTLIGSQPNSSLRVKVENTGDHYYYYLVNDDAWYGQAATPTPAAPARVGTPTRRPSPTAQRTAAPAGVTPVGTARPAQGASPQPQATARATGTPAEAPATNTAVAPPTNTAVAPPPTNTPAPPPPATNTPVPPATKTPAPPPGPTATLPPYP
jgi:hypothetical protein